MNRYEFMAYDYPVLGAFWTILWIFLWIFWLVLLFRVLTDLFRDHSLSGWAKAGWLLFVIVLPFLGVLVYVIVRGADMGKREVEHTHKQQEAFEEYIRGTATGGRSTAEELTRLSDLRGRGEISESEFQRAKEKILH